MLLNSVKTHKKYIRISIDTTSTFVIYILNYFLHFKFTYEHGYKFHKYDQ